jgi:hypothetical protein
MVFCPIGDVASVEMKLSLIPVRIASFELHPSVYVIVRAEYGSSIAFFRIQCLEKFYVFVTEQAL